jgi:hypothetical protein
MAPQQPITIIDPPAWERSTATTLSLNLLVYAASCDNPPRKIPYYRLRPIHFGH